VAVTIAALLGLGALNLVKLMADARAMSGSVHTCYFTLTVAGGAVDRVQELLAINAC
jgi:hypothetical protein